MLAWLMRGEVRSVGLPLFLLGRLAAAEDARPYSRLEAFAHSEPIAILRALDGWKGQDRSGERQYAAVWLEAGAAFRSPHKTWGIGLLRRVDYSFQFTRDTADLCGAIADNRPLVIGRTYNLDLRAHGLEARGIRGFLRREPRPDLTLEMGISLLQGTSLLVGHVQGQGRALEAKAYDYSLWADYDYTRDPLFGREVPRPKGWGVALDASVTWRLHASGILRARVQDLPGVMQWKQLPTTQAQAVNRKGAVDAEGFQLWNPFVSGVESIRTSSRQTLPIRGEAECLLGSTWMAGLGMDAAFGERAPRFGAGMNHPTGQGIIWISPTLRTIGFELRTKHWELRLSLDHPWPAEAHAIRLQLALKP